MTPDKDTDIQPHDAERIARRYRKRVHCKLDCEKGMPKKSASAEAWEAYHQQMLNRKDPDD